MIQLAQKYGFGMHAVLGECLIGSLLPVVLMSALYEDRETQLRRRNVTLAFGKERLLKLFHCCVVPTRLEIDIKGMTTSPELLLLINSNPRDPSISTFLALPA